jgi:hypothetical protein
MFSQRGILSQSVREVLPVREEALTPLFLLSHTHPSFYFHTPTSSFSLLHFTSLHFTSILSHQSSYPLQLCIIPYSFRLFQHPNPHFLFISPSPFSLHDSRRSSRSLLSTSYVSPLCVSPLFVSLRCDTTYLSSHFPHSRRIPNPQVSLPVDTSSANTHRMIPWIP